MPDPLADFDGAVFLKNAVLFTRALRSAGVPTDLGGALDFARALTLVDIGDRTQVHAAGSTIFCRRHADLLVYDVVFDQFWRRHVARIAPLAPTEGARRERAKEPNGAAAPESTAERRSERHRGRSEQAEPSSEGEDDREIGEGRVVSPRAFSTAEAFSHREFDRMSTSELRDAERLIDLLRPRLETRLTRRYEHHPHGRRLAPRAMFRRNLATGGDMVDWVWRRRVRRPRTIVVLCDVSGSMERHARLLLRFAQALTRTSGVRTESFVFGTRLTRITHELRGRDPDLAIRRVTETVTDWSGGTRIGESLRTFNLRWARRVLRSSGVVIVVSDGWDRGDPSLVGLETARLQRNCHRLIWLNPLAGSDGYEPLAAGMAAAYPSVDDFLPIHNLASLERLGEVLGGLGLGATGRPTRTGVPNVYRIEATGSGRRAITAVAPRVFGLPSRAGGAAIDPSAARPLVG
ncbi:MAG TPA: VWA domain-containing protein [Candidatus Nanopelagicales bacterium]|nr:VWA domain-containing protein [Candidatus Nanopelagicales bacterium]